MEKKKRSPMARRAWNLLRMALLWARKGGAFKRKLMLDLRVIPVFLKTLGGAHSNRRLGHRERQFSFDDTPTFHFKMHRPALMRHFHIPCVEPPTVDFDEDDCNPGYFYDRQDRMNADDRDDELTCEEEVDLKAEEFISQFYEHMKLQRQVSYLQYDEMLRRGTS